MELPEYSMKTDQLKPGQRVLIHDDFTWQQADTSGKIGRKTRRKSYSI